MLLEFCCCFASKENEEADNLRVRVLILFLRIRLFLLLLLSAFDENEGISPPSIFVDADAFGEIVIFNDFWRVIEFERVVSSWNFFNTTSLVPLLSL